MAIKLADNIKNFTLTSADTKPTAGTVVGSRAYETDTHDWYIYDGSNWHAEVTTTQDVTKAHISNGTRFTSPHWVSVGTGTAASMLITTAASGTVTDTYFAFSVHSAAQVKVTFGEAPDATGGTTITPINMNRQSSVTANTTTLHTTAYTSVGTILTQFEGSVLGGGVDSPEEYVLNHGTKYIIYVVAYAAATEISINAYFTEHT